MVAVRPSALPRAYRTYPIELLTSHGRKYKLVPLLQALQG